MYAYQEAPRLRVVTYYRVSTAKESFEMQVQHFKAVMKTIPHMSW